MAQRITSTLLNIQDDVSLNSQHPDFSNTLGVTIAQQHYEHGPGQQRCACGYGDGRKLSLASC